MRKCLITICMALSLFCLTASDARALPRNFRNVDTFFVGAMPSESDLDEFLALGIKTIISLHRLPPEVQKKAQKLGIELHSFPLRTRLLNIDQIMAVMRNAPENSVYLHCLHGADRTGAVTAYWLYAERHMNPFTALASVISPSEFHFRGFIQPLQIKNRLDRHLFRRQKWRPRRPQNLRRRMVHTPRAKFPHTHDRRTDQRTERTLLEKI